MLSINKINLGKNIQTKIVCHQSAPGAFKNPSSVASRTFSCLVCYFGPAKSGGMSLFLAVNSRRPWGVFQVEED